MCRGEQPSFCRPPHLTFYQTIESMLRNQSGIHSAKVALLAERAVIEFDPLLWTVPKLIDVGPFFHEISRRPHASLVYNRKFLILDLTPR
jgi:hypothetical protein